MMVLLVALASSVVYAFRTSHTAYGESTNYRADISVDIDGAVDDQTDEIFANDNDRGFWLDIPYEYPIRPERDAEIWKSYTTQEERFEACSVPDELLKAMTIRALVETVLDNPNIIGLNLGTDTRTNFLYMLDNMNCLQELVRRNDAVDALQRIVSEGEAYGYDALSNDRKLARRFNSAVVLHTEIGIYR